LLDLTHLPGDNSSRQQQRAGPVLLLGSSSRGALAPHRPRAPAVSACSSSQKHQHHPINPLLSHHPHEPALETALDCTAVRVVGILLDRSQDPVMEVEIVGLAQHVSIF
jgi:hypothetical protein